jgi:hypothetical protein
MDEKFIDGAVRSNNPIDELWNEAQDVWGAPLDTQIKCIISIGTGRPSVEPYGDSLFAVAESIRKIATDTESTAESFNQRHGTLYDEGIYYRLNVDRGLERVGLDESSAMATIFGTTVEYLTSQVVVSRLEKLKEMLGKSPVVLTGIELDYARQGQAAYDAKEWTQAVSLLRRALGERDAKLDDEPLWKLRTIYAQSLYMAGDPKSANALFEAVVKRAEKEYGENDLETIKRRRSWAYALDRSGLSLSAMEQFLLAAEAFERRANGTDTVDSLLCRYKHGELASRHEGFDRSWPYWNDAEKSLRRAARGLAHLQPSPDNETLEARMCYAEVLLKSCREDEALENFQIAQRLADRRRLPKYHESYQRINNGLEECRFWRRQAQSIRLGDRLPLAHRRAAEKERKESRLQATDHWSTM